MPIPIQAGSSNSYGAPGQYMVTAAYLVGSLEEAQQLRDAIDCLVTPNGRTDLECEECE